MGVGTKLIQVKTVLARVVDEIHEAISLAESAGGAQEGSEEEIAHLLDNLHRLELDARSVMPLGIREATENEIRSLAEPQFGWCSECGAEWSYNLFSPREPALRCADCAAPAGSRSDVRPKDPPKKDIRENPLMSFLAPVGEL